MSTKTRLGAYLAAAALMVGAFGANAQAPKGEKKFNPRKYKTKDIVTTHAGKADTVSYYITKDIFYGDVGEMYPVGKNYYALLNRDTIKDVVFSEQKIVKMGNKTDTIVEEDNIVADVLQLRSEHSTLIFMTYDGVKYVSCWQDGLGVMGWTPIEDMQDAKPSGPFTSFGSKIDDHLWKNFLKGVTLRAEQDASAYVDVTVANIINTARVNLQYSAGLVLTEELKDFEAGTFTHTGHGTRSVIKICNYAGRHLFDDAKSADDILKTATDMGATLSADTLYQNYQKNADGVASANIGNLLYFNPNDEQNMTAQKEPVIGMILGVKSQGVEIFYKDASTQVPAVITVPWKQIQSAERAQIISVIYGDNIKGKTAFPFNIFADIGGVESLPSDSIAVPNPTDDGYDDGSGDGLGDEQDDNSNDNGGGQVVTKKTWHIGAGAKPR